MSDDRFSRQSFLGAGSVRQVASTQVCIVGLGGGGSHLVQQLSHLGFADFTVYDSDIVDESNLNRLVGATEVDARKGTPKVEVAERVIRGLNPSARISARKTRWQNEPDGVRGADIVFGSVDTFAGRQELEACCRRYLVPYIDIGMDVHAVGHEPPIAAGQVILSMPGRPCLTCLGFLSEERLGREAALYGAAGGRPQVVWINGVLASTAVGLAVDLVTDWSRGVRGPVYLSYRANDGTVRPHVRLDYLKSQKCPHFPADMVGDPVLVSL